MNDTIKYAVVTGATGGIGSELCKMLVNNNYRIIALSRKEIKSSDKNIIYIRGNLDNIDEVLNFTNQVRSYFTGGETISCLFNNAGIIASEFETNSNQIERSVFINFIAPTIIIQNLIDIIDKNNGRIINTLSCTIFNRSAITKCNAIIDQAIYNQQAATTKLQASDSEYNIQKYLSDLNNKFIEIIKNSDLNREDRFSSLKNYSITKRLLAIYTAELNNNLKICKSGIISIGADPGIVNTGIITQHKWYDRLADIFFRPFIKPACKGALQLYRAATEDCAKEKRYSAGRSEVIIFKGKLFR